MSEWWKDPEWKEYADHVMNDMVPMLSESSMTFSIYPTSGHGDVKYWVELGASIMMDKPIIVIVHPGVSISERLKRVADHVLYADMNDDASREKLVDRLEQIAREISSE